MNEKEKKKRRKEKRGSGGKTLKRMGEKWRGGRRAENN